MNFWDSSALIEAHDTLSAERGRFLSLLRQKTLHAASKLIVPEVVAALARRSRNNLAERDRLLREAMDALARFLLHTVADDIVEDSIPIARSDGLKGADAVHLATALAMARDVGRKGFVFMTRDKEQAAAARRRGLRVIGA